jgi:thioester reductase-like protein
VLVTGPTTLVGSFLLGALLRSTPSEVYCLMSAADAAAARDLLMQQALRYGAFDVADLERLIPVLGAPTSYRFGLPDQEYQDLATSVDSVYHAFEIISRSMPYPALRAFNVSGTQEALRFAASGQLKTFHFISNLCVFPLAMAMRRRSMPESEVLEHEGLVDGYSQSKWVAERLCVLAAARGLPTNIYRSGEVVGTSDVGAYDGSGRLFRMLVQFLDMHAVPAAGHGLEIEATPVDSIATFVARASTCEQLSGGIYHLVNGSPIALGTYLGWLREYGYRLDTVSVAAWRKWTSKDPNGASVFADVNAGSRFAQVMTRLAIGRSGRPLYESSHALEACRVLGVELPELDRAMMFRLIEWAIANDLAPSP